MKELIVSSQFLSSFCFMLTDDRRGCCDISGDLGLGQRYRNPNLTQAL